MKPVNPFYTARHRPIEPSAKDHRLRVLDLFSGIGGFSLGLERAGMQTAAFCEIDPYCRSVLARHWPQVPIYSDIRSLTAEKLHHDRIHTIDLICGGIPANPSASPGSSEVNAIRVTSGQRCIDSFENSGRDGSFARTLLDTLNSVSTPYSMTWNLSARHVAVPTSGLCRRGASPAGPRMGCCPRRWRPIGAADTGAVRRTICFAAT